MKTLKKKPLQIYIEPDQANLLKMLAERKGVSKAAIIRDGLEKLICDLPVEDDPAMGLIGLGRSGKSDLSEKHDQYLATHTKSQKK